MGKTVLTEGTDYTYANNTLTIKATDNTGVGSYSMVFTDDTYSDIVASFTLESGYKTEISPLIKIIRLLFLPVSTLKNM